MKGWILILDNEKKKCVLQSLEKVKIGDTGLPDFISEKFGNNCEWMYLLNGITDIEIRS